MRRLQPSWARQAACRGADPDTFVPEQQPVSQPPIVTRLCPTCPVRSLCEEHGRATGSTGWWGGVYLLLGFTPSEWKRLASWARDLVLANDDNPDRDMRDEIIAKPLVLDQQLVGELRQRYAEGGRTRQQLADDYSVNVNTLKGVLYGTTWNAPRNILRGEDHPTAKLTRDNVVVIKQRLAAGERHKDIAVDYNVSVSAIADISCGRKWASVP